MAFASSNRLGEGTDTEKLAKFREIRDQIDSNIREWMLQYKLKQLDIRQRQE
ncbi:MAG: hypothetical protein ABI947_03610 [Chloroflexota bacterium]